MNRRARGPAPPRPPAWRHWLILAGVALTIASLLRVAGAPKPPVSLTYSQFLGDVTSDQVHSATIDANGAITGKLASGKSYTSQLPVALTDNTVAPLLEAHHVAITGEPPASDTLLSVILSFLPLLFFLGLFLWISRRAGRQMASVGGLTGSRAKLYDATKPATRFSDVAGYEGAKQEVKEVVDFLKEPERYTKIGAVGPKGVLMVGPPGTGKTLLARAVAGEAGVPFYSVTGSSFVEIFVGVGASRMRDLFAEARKRAPAIIFIDEIDAIGQRRGGAVVANDEREQTLNQMLAEMDGFDPSTGVVVMAATNRPETLDKALLRPGRFDRQVEIPLPNQKERTLILGLHAATKTLAAGVDLEAVARGTPGFSGADLANLVNEAAIVAIRAGRETIGLDDFFEARDRILLGRREASNALLPNEKNSVAVHEAGHALVAALSPHSDPVSKVTILPAGHALGVTQQLPVDERHLYPESYLQESLAIRMGGRAAERLVLGEVSTGAANDLAGATQLAFRMVREFGMSPRVGPVGFSSEDPAYLGDQPISSRQYSEDTQRVIDEEAERLLKEADERATALLTKHRASLDALTALLLEKETIDGDEVLAIAAGASGGQDAAALAHATSPVIPLDPPTA
ncbi:MAG TPA: ATP-dependent zinc metalloprotease FtsH [Actinomycetota bacterium]|nr:ATP-dependent zinc metalloprotease FtsH [Actinomycetota bacterium]